jgi:hypothetical protein
MRVRPLEDSENPGTNSVQANRFVSFFMRYAQELAATSPTMASYRK